MTTTLTVAAPVAGDATTTATWTAEFQRLRKRFPRAKDSILFCVHALQQSPDITLLDLKAQAALHGVRVTGSSRIAAARLLANHSTATEAATPATATPVRERRPRGPATADAEAMLRQVVARLRADGEAEAERLRGAIRKAIVALQAAVE